MDAAKKGFSAIFAPFDGINKKSGPIMRLEIITGYFGRTCPVSLEAYTLYGAGKIIEGERFF